MIELLWPKTGNPLVFLGFSLFNSFYAFLFMNIINMFMVVISLPKPLLPSPNPCDNRYFYDCLFIIFLFIVIYPFEHLWRLLQNMIDSKVKNGILNNIMMSTLEKSSKIK